MNERAKAGLTTGLDVEEARTNLESTRASSQAQVVTDLITLYKALGGGWTPGAPIVHASSAAGR